MPTRDEVYEAIRNADKAGDAESVQKLGAYLQTLPAEHGNAATQEPEQPSLAGRIVKETAERGVPSLMAGAGEAGLQAVTGGAGMIAGGLAGLLTNNADVVGKVAGAMTYRPRTAVGQGMSELGSIIPNAVEKTTDVAGEKVSEKFGPAAGAATKTALQALPMLAFRGKGKVAEAPETATARAQDYVTNRTSLGWDALSDRTKSLITEIAKDSKKLDQLDPQAVERHARLEEMGVPATRGQITRDLSQITKEENIKKSDAGKPIRDIEAEQDKVLHEHLDTLRKQTGSTAATRQQVGTSVQSAARSKLKYLEGRYNAKYKAAREAGETMGPVDSAPLNEWLNNPTNRRNAPYLEKALKDYAKKDGAVTINDMEEIRKEAVANALGPPSPTKHFAGEAVKIIDQVLDNAGSNLYKDARKAFRATKEEFSGQSAVKKLVSSKGGATDRSVALEDTFDNVVLRGSKEQLETVKKSLTEGGTVATRKNGTQAWKDLQAATIDYLKDKAAGKRAIPGEQSQLQFNSTFLDALYDLDKDGKLTTLFGEKTTAQIQKIAQATRDVRTKPAGRVAGSDTVPRIISMLEKVSKIPVVGELAAGTVKAGQKIHEMGKEAKEVSKATRSPLEDPIKKKKLTLKDLNKYQGVVPTTLEQGQQ